jgi:hypothetical protein
MSRRRRRPDRPRRVLAVDGPLSVVNILVFGDRDESCPLCRALGVAHGEPKPNRAQRRSAY